MADSAIVTGRSKVTVRNILEAKGASVVAIAPTATVEEAVSRLKQAGIGALVVSGDGRRVEGIISERDVVRGLADHGHGVYDRPVRQLMTTEVFTCSPDDSTTAVMAAMTERRFRHVPVVENGELCGIISVGDILKKRVDEVQTEANALRQYIATA